MAKQTIFHFERAGLQTTVQDKGRLGYQHLGIPVGGALDQQAAAIANWLVGNPEEHPVLEIPIMGPQIFISKPCQIALTGADLSPKLNNKTIPLYQTINIPKKSSLHFGALRSGCRAYLAIGGTWQLEKWLSSYSPLLNNGQVLPPTSMIQQNQQLTIQVQSFITTRQYSFEQGSPSPSCLRVRVLAGPEFHLFSRISIAAFFSRPHLISKQSNRMGYRLESQVPDFRPQQELISSGIVPGTIQISNAGQPIILLQDAPTTGGYYRIANIHSEDLSLIAQLKPQDSIEFTLVTEESF